mmetsp:Transcript_26454/g.57438  ORF Transcript_26454/g.57438 Transcript_26454/m.57438 type:complete len:1181 (-) Transcript_26454:102-3644(-)
MADSEVAAESSSKRDRPLEGEDDGEGDVEGDAGKQEHSGLTCGGDACDMHQQQKQQKDEEGEKEEEDEEEEEEEDEQQRRGSRAVEVEVVSPYQPHIERLQRPSKVVEADRRLSQSQPLGTTASSASGAKPLHEDDPPWLAEHRHSHELGPPRLQQTQSTSSSSKSKRPTLSPYQQTNRQSQSRAFPRQSQCARLSHRVPDRKSQSEPEASDKQPSQGQGQRQSQRQSQRSSRNRAGSEEEKQQQQRAQVPAEQVLPHRSEDTELPWNLGKGATRSSFEIEVEPPRMRFAVEPQCSEESMGYPDDDEDDVEPPPQKGRCGCALLFVHIIIVNIFPFLLLLSFGGDELKKARQKFREVRSIRPARKKSRLTRNFLALVSRCQAPCVYFAMLGGWTLSCCLFLYVLLAVGASQSIYPPSEISHTILHQIQTKIPDTGDHLPFIAIVKQVLTILVFRRLCFWMQPQMHLVELRETDTGDLYPTGVFDTLGNFGRRVLCKPAKTRWFTSFLADHLLLWAVGVPFGIYQVMLVPVVKQATSTPGLPHLPLTDHTRLVIQIIRTVGASYGGIMVGGFLMAVLGNFAVPRPGKQLQVFVFLACGLVLWASDFVLMVEEKTHYHGGCTPLDGLNKTPTFRLMSALAQIFVTHSSAMLGAVIMGHSSHLKKSPDLLWRTFWLKLFPVCFIFGFGHMVMVYGMTHGQMHPTCRHHFWILARIYPYVLSSMKICLGIVLLLSAFLHFTDAPEDDPLLTGNIERTIDDDEADFDDHVHATHSTHEVHLDYLARLPQYFCYDAVLIMITFTIAILWNIVNIYFAKAQHTYWTLVVHLAELAAPTGLALFAICFWQRPVAKKASQRHLLWVALALGLVSFGHYVYLEDCEVSGYLPACCKYPGLPDFNNHLESGHVCNMDRRCEDSFWPSDDFVEPGKVKEPVFCLLKKFSNESDGHGHGHGHGSGHGSGSSQSSHASSSSHGSDSQDSEESQHDDHDDDSDEAGSSHGSHAAAGGDGEGKQHDAGAQNQHEGGGAAAAEGEEDGSSIRESLSKLWRRLTGHGETETSSESQDQSSTCEVLQDRWDQFRDKRWTALEIFEEFSELSTVYMVFNTLGQVGSVEFYFTVLGVLLKLIIMAEHPNSETILKAHEVYHTVDSHGNAHVEELTRSFISESRPSLFFGGDVHLLESSANV